MVGPPRLAAGASLPSKLAPHCGFAGRVTPPPLTRAPHPVCAAPRLPCSAAGSFLSFLQNEVRWTFRWRSNLNEAREPRSGAHDIPLLRKEARPPHFVVPLQAYGRASPPASAGAPTRLAPGFAPTSRWCPHCTWRRSQNRPPRAQFKSVFEMNADAINSKV